MEQNKIDMFVMQNSKCFTAYQLQTIKDALAKLDDSKFMHISSLQLKDPTTMLVISILIGSLGIDRMMLGEAGLGVLKLLTCGGCYVWWIIDMINIQDKARQYNFDLVKNALMMQGVSIF